MLFDPLTLRGLTFRNRIGVSPMCQYSAQDGFANDWHLVHLGSRAAGGAGLVIMEATGVEPRGRISPNDLGIWKDEHIVKLEQITRFIASQGAVAGIQLAHAGRKASTPQPWAGDKPLTAAEGGWIPVAPSAIAFDQQYQVPMALKTEEIINIIELFKSAARRALQSGFKVVEVHSAHGYLLHEFLSPISNQRLDSYGGSFDNRVRLLEEVVAAIRSVWPEEYPLFVRISATDWIEPEGWTLEQSLGLAGRLKKLGVDLIDCSSGGLVTYAKIPAGPGYQVPFAARIRREAGIPTAAVGVITNPVQAETILRSGQADMILLGRESLRDPYWPMHAAVELRNPALWPRQYARARLENR